MRALTLILIVISLAVTYGQKRVLFGMGSNAKGQLAQNDVTFPTLLFSTVGGSPISKICTSVNQGTTAGMWRIIAVNTNGGVYGWGNIVGASLLGLGSQYPNRAENLPKPTLIMNLGELATSLACGERHTLIRTASGIVYGFGENEAGQLGNANTTALLQPTRLPQFEGYDKIWAVGTNTFTQHNSSLNNRLYGVGANSYSQLGNSSSDFIVKSLIEVQVPNTASFGGNEVVVQITGSNEHLFYLTDAGNLYVVGVENQYGRLGLGSSKTSGLIADHFTLVQTNIKLVNTIASSTVAVSKDGLSTYVWGNNANSILCLPSSTASVNVPTLVTQLSAQSFQIINAKLSGEHSIFVTNNGQIYGCGVNNYNQLGVDYRKAGWVDTTAKTTGPLQTKIDPTLTATASDFVLSSSTSFFLTNAGELYGWGRSDFLGITFQFPNIFQIKQGLNNLVIDKIYVGNQFSALYANGTYHVFGANSFTNIMSNTSLDFFSPVTISAFTGYNLTDLSIGGGLPMSTTPVFQRYANIFGWDNTTYPGVNKTLSLHGIGNNDLYQLGLGPNSATTDAPVLVPQNVRSGSDLNGTVIVNKIESGFAHSGMIATAGGLTSLYVWGSNSNGQIGFRTLPQRETMIRVTTGIVDMAVGDFHTIYIQKTISIRTTGQVITYNAYSTGYNKYGQLGLGNIFYSTAFLPVGGVLNDTVNPLSNLTLNRVWTGSDQTWISTNLGVFVMGDNRYGQLGLGNDTLEVRQPILHPFFNNTNVQEVACAKNGGSHTIVLMNDGRIYVMGRNDNGQLGLGDIVNRFTPVLVPKSTFAGATSTNDVIAVAAGVDHSLLIVGQRDCPDDCNGQGICNTVTGVCSCFDEYLGDSCNLYQCWPRPDCNLHGYCDTSRGVCVCAPSSTSTSLYSGLSCEYRRCDMDCSGRGQCDRNTGSCKCDKGYTGLGCQFTSNANTATMSIVLVVLVIVLML